MRTIIKFIENARFISIVIYCFASISLLIILGIYTSFTDISLWSSSFRIFIQIILPIVITVPLLITMFIWFRKSK